MLVNTGHPPTAHGRPGPGCGLSLVACLVACRGAAQTASGDRWTGTAGCGRQDKRQATSHRGVGWGQPAGGGSRLGAVGGARGSLSVAVAWGSVGPPQALTGGAVRCPVGGTRRFRGLLLWGPHTHHMQVRDHHSLVGVPHGCGGLWWGVCGGPTTDTSGTGCDLPGMEGGPGRDFASGKPHNPLAARSASARTPPADWSGVARCGIWGRCMVAVVSGYWLLATRKQPAGRPWWPVEGCSSG